jgi:hypothetical protein
MQARGWPTYAAAAAVAPGPILVEAEALGVKGWGFSILGSYFDALTAYRAQLCDAGLSSCTQSHLSFCLHLRALGNKLALLLDRLTKKGNA